MTQILFNGAGAVVYSRIFTNPKFGKLVTTLQPRTIVQGRRAEVALIKLYGPPFFSLQR